MLLQSFKNQKDAQKKGLWTHFWVFYLKQSPESMIMIQAGVTRINSGQSLTHTINILTYLT